MNSLSTTTIGEDDEQQQQQQQKLINTLRGKGHTCIEGLRSCQVCDDGAMECICDDTSYTKVEVCERCETPYVDIPHEYIRKSMCKLHGHKFGLMCGGCANICSQCKGQGWYSTKGNGGGTNIFINEKTGEKIDKTKKYDDDDDNE